MLKQFFHNIEKRAVGRKVVPFVVGLKASLPKTVTTRCIVKDKHCDVVSNNRLSLLISSRLTLKAYCHKKITTSLQKSLSYMNSQLLLLKDKNCMRQIYELY